MLFKKTTRTIGQETETQACQYLEKQGMKLLERNFYGPNGELDLIMSDRTSLVFIEVRYRKNNNFGSAAETINKAKQKKLYMTALYYLQTKPGYADKPARFDVVSISGANKEQNINWIKNAFQAPI